MAFSSKREMKNLGNPQDSQAARGSGFRTIDGTPPQFGCVFPRGSEATARENPGSLHWAAAEPLLLPVTHAGPVLPDHPPRSHCNDLEVATRPDYLLDPRDAHGGRRDPSPDSCPLTSTFTHCGSHKLLLHLDT